MSDVTDVLKQYSEDVVKTIEENLSVIEPQDLQDACLYLTKAGGKMLRPALTLISAEAVGGKKEDALKTAAALELIHTFSLIHDDIMDDDDMRRGMPSVHKVWDEPVAILAGDTLFSKAFEMVISSKEEDAHPANVANALATVADACVKICEGQASDMGFEDRFDVTEDEYMEKTLLQFALDYNVEEGEWITEKIHLSPVKILKGARIHVKHDTFFKAAIIMGKAYVMADEVMHSWIKEVLAKEPPEWWCDFKNLRKLESELNKYGREIFDTHIYFLPSEEQTKLLYINMVGSIKVQQVQVGVNVEIVTVYTVKAAAPLNWCVYNNRFCVSG